MDFHVLPKLIFDARMFHEERDAGECVKCGTPNVYKRYEKRCWPCLNKPNSPCPFPNCTLSRMWEWVAVAPTPGIPYLNDSELVLQSHCYRHYESYCSEEDEPDDDKE